MGGKQKQAQRTKGNTRPSSSGRSAERLIASGATSASVNDFSRFTSLMLHREHPGTMKSQDPSGEIDPLIDGDIRMLMKKMTKKDAITRLKALQEFQTLCCKCNEELLLGALPFWPRLFNKLCLDPDRRVREATYIAHLELVSRVKRNLAPHLKIIMGNWLLGRYDPYAPAASAAKSAFQKAFNKEKRADALLYCKEEIFNVVIDNLFHQTPQTLCDPEVTQNEEVEETYNRVLSSSMLVLGFFLDVVPQVEHENFIEFYKQIVTDGKFWRHAKNEVQQVRGAWFKLIAIMCRVLPTVLEGQLSKLCPTVLGLLEEGDPVVASVIWDAALHIVVAFKEWWKHCNVQKAVLPKIFSTLSKGCNGNASLICPYMLPFLSVLPEDFVGTSGTTYVTFFTSLREGLSMELVRNRPSDARALITTFFECLKFVLGKHSRESDLPSTFSVSLLLEQVLPILKCSLTEETFRLLSCPLNSLLGDLVRYIHAHCASSEIQSTFFKNIEKVFWNAFKELCNSIFRDCEDLELYSVNSLCLMFASFYNYEKSHVLSRKITRVKFPDSSVVEELATTSKRHERDTLVLALDGTFVADITDPIVQCAFDLCVVGCTAFISNKSFLHLKFLSEMCSTFACNDLFEILLKRCGLLDSSKEDASTDASFKFFEHFVVKWLLSLECEETEVVTSAVKLLFSVFRCVEEADQKLVILNEICHLKSLSILEEVVKTMLPMSSDYDVAQRWFQGTNFNLLILESVKMLILVARSHSCQNIKNPQTSQVWDLLTLCLTTPVDDSEIILPDSYVGQLLMQLHNLLIYISDIKALDNSFIQEMLVNFCKFSHHFFKNVPFCWKFSESYNVLLSLFKLSCGKVQCDAELHDEIQNTWTTGVRSLISTQEVEKPRNFLNSAAGYIHNLIFFDQHPAYNFEMMSCAVVSLLKITKECLFTESSLEEDFMSKFSLLDELIHLMLPTEEEWDQMNEKLNQIIVLGDIINGKLFFSSLLSITEQYHSSDIPLAFSILTFDIFDELFSKDIVSRISNFERFSIHLMGVLNTATYCRLAKESIKNPSVIIFGKDSTYWAKVFDTRIKYVFHSMLLKQFGLQFLKNCLHKAQLKGGLWAHCLLEVVSFLMDYNFTINLKKLLDVNLALESDFGLHVIQILSSLDPKLNLEILSSFFKEKCNDYMLPTLSSARYIVIISTFLDAMPEHAFEMSDVSDIVVKTMDVLVRWKNSDIFASGLSGEWESLCINMEMAKTMSIIVIKYHQMLSSKHWDFILCHLGSSIQSLNECCKTDLLPEVKLFGGIIFHLTAAVGKTMNDFSSSINEVYNLPPDLITEWNEFFSHPLFSSLLDIFVKTTYRCDFSHQISLGDSYFFEIIVESLKWIPSNVIINNDLPLLLNAQWDDSDGAIPVKVKTVLNYLCPLLVSFVHDVQLGAHAILSNLMFALPQYDGHSNEKDDTKTFPGALLEVLLDSHKFVQVLLRDVKFGELFILDPVTDINSYKFLSGYLYSWNLILQMFISASSELRSKYANYLRESRLSDNLMRCLFSLMPNNPSLSSEHIYQKGSSRSGCPHLRSLFSEPPTLHLKCQRSTVSLQHIAWCIYYKALRCIPALIREWWNGLDRRAAQIVEKFTTKFVSPLLCSENILGVQNAEKKFDNMTVKTRPTAKEVMAIYAVDEISFELVVKLPDNHPLGAVTIETGRRVGVSTSQWSYWLLQLTTFLTHQNGTILDALILWKRNIDKKFEGVEECYVCFYVVHTSTCQLPRLTCRTCKKKFHSSCLYKWFNTSGHSTCPLCRSIF